MITLSDYFNNKTSTSKQSFSAVDLLKAVNELLDEFTASTGRELARNLKTGNLISGSRYGDGGFRLATSTTGAELSSHKEARGIDVADINNRLDDWLTDELLEEFSLYREDPGYTPNWCHLTTRAPHSGHRTFVP
jgi:hypothetical protein